jgi:hypothetical protein
MNTFLKLRRYSHPDRCDFLFKCGLNSDQVCNAWTSLYGSLSVLKVTSHGSFSFSDWFFCTLEIQKIFFEQLFYPCDPKPTMDDISDFFVSVTPVELGGFIGDCIRDFVISVTYPIFFQGSLEEYKTYLSWLDKLSIHMDDPLGELYDLSTSDVEKPIREDFHERKIADKLLKGVTVGEDFREDPQFPLWESECKEMCRSTIWEVKFLCYVFALNPISRESVLMLLGGLKLIAGYKAYLMVYDDGKTNFAMCCRIGFSLIRDESLKIMLQNVAYVLAQRNFIYADDKDMHDVRIRAIATWFKPWYGVDLLSVPLQAPAAVITRVCEFECAVNAELDKLYCFADLDIPLYTAELNDILGIFKKVYATTELSLEFIDLVLKENQSSVRFSEGFLYFLTREVATDLNIKMSKNDPRLQNYLKYPLDLNCFDGVHSTIYPRWRCYVMKRFLATPVIDKVSFLKSLLRDPLSSELEMALDSENKGKKAPKLGNPRREVG